MGNDSTPVISKKDLYGTFQAQDNIDADYHNGRRTWQNKLDQKLAHKALDIAIDPNSDDPMISADKTTTVNNGFDWKHLAVIAVAGLGSLGIFKFAPQGTPAIPAPTVSTPAPISQDYTTEIEIRDARTHQPIRVDWLKAESAPKPNVIPSSPVPSK